MVNKVQTAEFSLSSYRFFLIQRLELPELRSAVILLFAPFFRDWTFGCRGPLLHLM